jgi:hypothetical protein
MVAEAEGAGMGEEEEPSCISHDVIWKGHASTNNFNDRNTHSVSSYHTRNDMTFTYMETVVLSSSLLCDLSMFSPALYCTADSPTP